jgi:WD40 repeat protein
LFATGVVWADDAKERAVLRGHAKGVYAVAFSADGKTLVSGSLDATIRFWDVASGKELRSVPVQAVGVLALAVSRDGKALAASIGPDVCILDVASGRERATLKDHPASVFSIVWMADGKTLLTADAHRTVRIWDAASGRERKTLELREREAINCLSLTRDGKTAALAVQHRVNLFNPGQVQLWDVAEGKQTATLKHEGGAVLSTAFSPDGKTVVAGTFDGKVVGWEVSSGRRQFVLAGHTHGVQAVGFAPDGRRVLSGGNVFPPSGGRATSSEFRVWDVAARKEIASFRGREILAGAAAFAVSPDGQLLATGDAGENNSITLWNLPR